MSNKIVFITFASMSHSSAREELVSVFKKIGVEHIMSYTEKDLSPDFINENIEIFNFKKGYGYWMWKPYLVLETFSKLDDGDIVVYMDSTDLPTENFPNFIKQHFLTNDIYIIHSGGLNPHDKWTKKDCFVLMNCDDEKYHNKIQLDAGIFAVKKTEFNKNLMEEWLSFCKNKNIITDLPNICGLPNHSTFIEHRHDQSILTNLSIKYDIPTLTVDSSLYRSNHYYLQSKINWNL